MKTGHNSAYYIIKHYINLVQKNVLYNKLTAILKNVFYNKLTAILTSICKTMPTCSSLAPNHVRSTKIIE